MSRPAKRQIFHPMINPVRRQNTGRIMQTMRRNWAKARRTMQNSYLWLEISIIWDLDGRKALMYSLAIPHPFTLSPGSPMRATRREPTGSWLEQAMMAIPRQAKTDIRPPRAARTTRRNSSPSGTIWERRRVKSAILQMFVDDFQSPVWKSNFQATINGRRAPFLEDVLNSLDQTGPIGKLITVQIPEEFLGELKSGVLTINIDDPTTGAGDGFAVDFVRLLINPKTMTNTGTVSGTVTDEETGVADQWGNSLRHPM